MASFKELEVFKLSVQYVKSIYQITKSYPKEEKYGLVSQLRDAAIGIPSCIAESTGRRTANDRKHFIDIALASLYETHSQLIVSEALEYIAKDRLNNAEPFIEKLKAKLIAYQNSIKNRPSNT
ncbi:MAG: four helix bundle protein [Candidatus Marinimicrobia bacterium]|nr:four helix bundle protein [Candidatus Neomarinimicrobiota bacterium]MCH7764268.1 four helix bundle protein [Candidatus Neomarinimicrobiota bacterium]